MIKCKALNPTKLVQFIKNYILLIHYELKFTHFSLTIPSAYAIINKRFVIYYVEGQAIF